MKSVRSTSLAEAINLKLYEGIPNMPVDSLNLWSYQDIWGLILISYYYHGEYCLTLNNELCHSFELELR